MSVRPSRAVHTQIADELRADVLAGRLAPGVALPSETELGVFYGVSRATINRAVAELRREHLVEVRRGVGTYVTAADTVDYRVSWPREVWAGVSVAADREDVTVGEWVVQACRERLGDEVRPGSGR